MRGQNGSAMMAAVLLLMLFGVLLLRGLEQVYELRMQGVGIEIRRIRAATQAHSALSWALTQRWQAQPAWQCLAAQGGGVACVRALDSGLLLLGQDDEGLLRFWRRASLSAGRIMFNPRGWSDFCPLADTAQCAP
ncbi:MULTISPECIES: DUF2509 family protein [Tenebrionibacter/Tenebrionicola group]|uniref:DUF2509 family protein n=2 Tax=Tenebrionibacter/Tenebrionicola group TaxID=2969848 RepID=A0A8K0XWA8_9ENTR|nr:MULTISPECIES: DUF2509 family protein [Tenebrionibacter/Tenebrionicola group]MBK4714916.1 DUF2509 family protein [Tenebrionibacter intestinalis]MBV5095742.1 DUF2509 family protein [Tenebrionicola larvae]